MAENDRGQGFFRDIVYRQMTRLRLESWSYHCTVTTQMTGLGPQ